MSPTFFLRDLPKYENLRAMAQRYPEVDPDAISAYTILLRVATDVMNDTESALACHGLSRGRFTVLAILNRNPDVPLSPVDLARRCGVTRATMTGLLDGLERHGLVTRREHEEDRRMQMIRLSEKGRQFLDAFLPTYYARLAHLMAPLTAGEQQTLSALLTRVGGALAAAEQEALTAGENEAPNTASAGEKTIPETATQGHKTP